MSVRSCMCVCACVCVRVCVCVCDRARVCVFVDWAQNIGEEKNLSTQCISGYRIYLSFASFLKLYKNFHLRIFVMLSPGIQSFATTKAIHKMPDLPPHSDKANSKVLTNHFKQVFQQISRQQFWQNILFDAFRIYVWSTIQREKRIFF